MKRDAAISAELITISTTVAEAGNNNPYEWPVGYFEQLAERILLHCKAAENNPLADVPAGYFEHLPTAILTKIEGTAAHELQQISPLLAAIPKKNPFETPAGYFETLGNEWVPEETLPAILLNSRQMQPYQVPDQYFEQLPSQLLTAAKATEKATLFAMPAGKKVFKIASRWAAAAVFTGLLSIGAYRYIHPAMPSGGNKGAQLASFIEEGKKIDPARLDEKMDNLEEEAIVKYLEKNGSESDIAALSASLEEGNLPDQEEYLNNEQTLDNFIQSINNTKN